MEIGIGREDQLAGIDVRDQDRVARIDGDAIVLQHAIGRNGGDDHGLESVRHGVVGIAEAEIRRREGIGHVLIGCDGGVRTGRGVIQGRGDVDRHAVGGLIEVHAAIGDAAVILHLEGEIAEARARTGAGRIDQLVGGDVRNQDKIAGIDGDAIVLQHAARGHGGDLDRQEIVAVMDVAEAELRRREGVAGVRRHGEAVVGAGRGVIHRIDGDGHGVGGRIGVHAAIADAAVILDLEGEGGRAMEIGVGRKDQLVGGDVADQNGVARIDGDAIVLEHAVGRNGGDLDGREIVAVMGVAEAEIRRREDISGVFIGGDGGVRSRRRVIHRIDRDGHGVGGLVGILAAAHHAAIILHLEGEGGGAMEIGVGRKDQLVGGDVRDQHRVARIDGDAIVLQHAIGRNGGDLDGLEIVRRRVARIAEAEIRRRESIGGVFIGGDGGVRPGRGVVHRGIGNEMIVGHVIKAVREFQELDIGEGVGAVARGGAVGDGDRQVRCG